VDKATAGLEKLEEKVDKDPNDKKLMELGKAYCDLGMMEKGKVTFERLMNDYPEDPNGPARVGMTLGGMEKHRESLPYFEKALEIKPKMQHAKRGKTWALWSLGELFEMPDE
jgi:tetratricopeptide (TPR) repeat protein